MTQVEIQQENQETNVATNTEVETVEASEVPLQQPVNPDAFEMLPITAPANNPHLGTWLLESLKKHNHPNPNEFFYVRGSDELTQKAIDNLHRFEEGPQRRIVCQICIKALSRLQDENGKPYDTRFNAAMLTDSGNLKEWKELMDKSFFPEVTKIAQAIEERNKPKEEPSETPEVKEEVKEVAEQA